MLILPYLDIRFWTITTLGIDNQDATDDQVTIDAAYAIKKHGVGVKCDDHPDEPKEEFNLKMWLFAQWDNPNILGGTIFANLS